jgi:O-antigen/teichoic acid export membrane protein
MLPSRRNRLLRRLAANAVTKPTNVLVPAAVLAGAAFTGAVWLVVVALVTWLALAAATFLDEREAERLARKRRRAP